MTRMSACAGLLVAMLAPTSCAMIATPKAEALASPSYNALLQRSEVWRPTTVGTMNLRTGPAASDGFAPLATVRCAYDDKEMGGKTPKFTCVLPDGDELKVKYGRHNGEVYAEVAATRLMWALGFGADRIYPVTVECTGCPPALAAGDAGASSVAPGVTRFEFATIERKMDGREIESTRGSGWSWQNLREVEPSGPDARAHRDALTLLMVMIQHTDSKRGQQRLVCLDDDVSDDKAALMACTRPFMMVNDVGKTFGRATAFNRDTFGAVNLRAWQESQVWLHGTGCIARIQASVTGTLDDPTISEAGRKFLADLLVQLTGAQLRDLFEVARFADRTGAGTPAGVEAWVAAFQDKVAQIAGRTCPETQERT